MNIPLYLCDTEKNSCCQKTACEDPCILTANEEFAVLDEDEIPIVVYYFKKEE